MGWEASDGRIHALQMVIEGRAALFGRLRKAAIEHGVCHCSKHLAPGRKQLAVAPGWFAQPRGARAQQRRHSRTGHAQAEQSASLHGKECCIIARAVGRGYRLTGRVEPIRNMKELAASTILQHLTTVASERSARQQDASLDSRVVAIKAYQQRRFEQTYADLLTHPRYAGASNFFLHELYGPNDFTQRDAQFVRIVPALVRLFPTEVVKTVEALAALHAMSERFDTLMARQLDSPSVDPQRYCRAWQLCGDRAGREQQILLMEHVGRSLDSLTRNPLLRHSLRLMRAPARAAGMVALQSFLESGFETFRTMRGADEFLAWIGERERALAAALFTIEPSAAAKLGQLP